ncbi:DUF3040 domain-containing protein [Tenggerimyces flavus]|uniref:DUF3040 domain-containing protein n=1 Tax=Tenggerimyces flavus TaxID=1708749 RepID=A0ABV7Y6R4_9ACTN|nr:DUF3040 domain-containing protein [Tenggerimyces flavus]MBM7788610.1 cytochrome c biogenesis protein CcdA [Tenggerimyces flavus]
MPLSDHEQRLLEQMERALAADDPKLASALRGVDLRTRQRRRALIAAVVFVLGVALLFTSVIVFTNNVGLQIGVSVVGFLVMLVSAYYVATSLRQMPAAGEMPKGVIPIKGRGRRGGGGSARQKRHGNFMSRMEERWRRRRESGGL